MYTSSYRPARPSKKGSKPKRWLLLLIGVLLATGIFFGLRKDTAEAPILSQEEQSKETAKEQTPAVQPLPSVQSVVEAFVAQNPGQYSVVVTDLATGTELASYGADTSHFAASIYKLYVAYLGYIDIQAGKQKLEDPFLGTWNLKDCLDKMIRESHSPCAEKLWIEQGKDVSTARLKEFGLTRTSMTGIKTTAHDADLILARLDGRKELNETHTQLFLESMRLNIYRDGIPKALPDLVVRDKVGFSEFKDYHDVAIVTLPNNRHVSVTMLSRDVGTRHIGELTKKIFEPLIAASR